MALQRANARGTAPRQGSARPNVACKAINITRRDVLLGAATAPLLLPTGASAAQPKSIYDFTAIIEGQERSLAEYKNQNVNYPGLRTLYDKYKADGFNLIAFPCNQFGGQAPGTSEEERAWAHKKFGFQFDVFDKIDVNGKDAHPLYKYLRAQQPISLPGSQARPNGDIEWNYVKFMINREGQPVKRFKSAFDPIGFEGDVRLLLAGKETLPGECIMHPGRKVCNVDKLLAV